jgi:trigger factor
MQVSVETTKGLERKLTINIPSEKVEQAVNVKVEELAKKVKLDGFRPGKVPVRVVKQRFSAGVREEVAREMISSSLQEALQEKELMPAAMPSVEPGEITKGVDFTFTAIFDVFPEIEIKELDGIEIEQVKANVKESDLEAMIEKLREQRKVYKETAKASANGDKVKIDFEGFVNDEAFEGGKAEGYELELGSKSMIPGFEDGLVGVKSGDELSINVTFPEQYNHEKLAGQPAVFKIKVHSVLASELPEVDEEFVKAFEVESGKLDDLKEKVQKNMERELTSQVRTQNKQNVFDAFIEANKIDLPVSLIDQEIETMTKEMIHRVFGDKQPSKDMPSLPREMFEAQATRRVHLGLLVSEYIKSHEMKATDERVEALLEEMAGAYDKPEELKQWYRSNKKQMNELEGVVLEDMVVEKLLSHAVSKELEKDYDSVMNPPQPEVEEEKTDKNNEEEA